jgi:peroxiredoxin
MDTLNPLPNDLLAPQFTLPDLEGHPHSLKDFRNRIVIINFWSAECPWSQRCDTELRSLLDEWGKQVDLLTVASNANESIEMLKQAAAERQLPIVLHDADQIVADLYRAKTTPHLFVLDSNGILRYQGAFDDITFRQREATAKYLPAAIEALLAGRKPENAQITPYGCALVRHSAE